LLLDSKIVKLLLTKVLTLIVILKPLEAKEISLEFAFGTDARGIVGLRLGQVKLIAASLVSMNLPILLHTMK
jgi:hypothetical protein